MVWTAPFGPGRVYQMVARRKARPPDSSKGSSSRAGCLGWRQEEPPPGRFDHHLALARGADALRARQRLRPGRDRWGVLGPELLVAQWSNGLL